MSFEHQIAQRKEVAQALGHLLALDQKKPHMKPEVCKRLTGERLGLCDFVFVVRKNQVFATRVQIESLTQFLHCHDRALDVPARPPRPDHRLP